VQGRHGHHHAATGPSARTRSPSSAYAELRDLFGQLQALPTTCTRWWCTGAGGNFCSGGDVHEIIGPLIRLTAPELLMPSPA
jgi:hypothetical protein